MINHVYPQHDPRNMGGSKAKNFVAYEYKDITTEHSMESFYADGYQYFGWQLEGIFGTMLAGRTSTLKFKRDRKILNKAELTRLQRQFEACAREIMALERSKTANATIAAIFIGLVGAAFMALSVFAITAPTPHVLLCIVFSIPGFVGWILPYFVFKGLSGKRAQVVEPLIDAKYDEAYEVCEKANSLLPK